MRILAIIFSAVLLAGCSACDFGMHEWTDWGKPEIPCEVTIIQGKIVEKLDAVCQERSCKVCGRVALDHVQ